MYFSAHYFILKFVFFGWCNNLLSSRTCQVIELYHPLALRLFLIGTHYRSPVNYSDVLLETASERIFYIYQVSQLQYNVVARGVH